MNKKIKHFSIDDKIANSKFSFTKNLKYFLIAPIIITIIGIVLLCTLGFNLGFDFTGGTNMTVYTNGERLENGAFSEQSYDVDNDEDYNAVLGKIDSVLSEFGLEASSYQKTTIDINADRGLGFVISDGGAVIVKFQNGDGDVEEINNKIRLALMEEFGYISLPENTDIMNLDDSAVQSFIDGTNHSALIANGGVTTASASSELMMRSFLALLVAIVLILIYVAIRFELTSGLAAILALFHDIIITSSIMLICRVQINSAFIAALITILGYSINNTIIIFDRIRENVKMSKNLGKINTFEVADRSVRQTLTRSILTTLTTFIMIFFVTVIGVSDIQEFAFPIMIGILSGFYSSVFLTPGLWAIAYRPSKQKIARMEAKRKRVDKGGSVAGDKDFVFAIPIFYFFHTFS